MLNPKLLKKRLRYGKVAVKNSGNLPYPMLTLTLTHLYLKFRSLDFLFSTQTARTDCRWLLSIAGGLAGRSQQVHAITTVERAAHTFQRLAHCTPSSLSVADRLTDCSAARLRRSRQSARNYGAKNLSSFQQYNVLQASSSSLLFAPLDLFDGPLWRVCFSGGHTPLALPANTALDSQDSIVHHTRNINWRQTI